VVSADSKFLVIDLHIDVCHTFWQGGACELVKLGICSPNRLSFVAFHSVMDMPILYTRLYVVANERLCNWDVLPGKEHCLEAGWFIHDI
jgi:hypothetical protein